MKILCGMEYSGRVSGAFRKLGHEVLSCDLLESETDGNHYQGDIRDVINDPWDLFIWFPDCRYLCCSGLHRNKNNPIRQQSTEQALNFVFEINDKAKHIKRRAFENPIGCISTRFKKPNQIIQPYNFGEDASKATCLWLTELPLLVPTQYIQPRIINGRNRWSNQTDSGQNKLTPSADRWKDRARTYQGIADAMAAQWGYLE